MLMHTLSSEIYENHMRAGGHFSYVASFLIMLYCIKQLIAS